MTSLEGKITLVELLTSHRLLKYDQDYTWYNLPLDIIVYFQSYTSNIDLSSINQTYIKNHEDAALQHVLHRYETDVWICFPLLALPPPPGLYYFCFSTKALMYLWKGIKVHCLLQVHPVPPASEHPGTGREPDREVQLQLRGGSYSCASKLN